MLRLIAPLLVSANAVAEPRTFTAEVEGGPAIPLGFSTDAGPAIGAAAGWFVLPELALEVRAIGYEAHSDAFDRLWLGLIEPQAKLWLGDHEWVAAGIGPAYGPVHGLFARCTPMMPCTPTYGWTVGGEARVGHHFGDGPGFEIGAAAVRVGVFGATNVTAFLLEGGYQWL